MIVINRPFFHHTITLNETVNKLRSQNCLIDCAKLIKESLEEVDFDLDDKFCDGIDLETSWKNMKIPEPLLIFFQNY